MKTGLDTFLASSFKQYQDLRWGVLCLPCSVDESLTHISERLTHPSLKLQVECFFGAQHGIRGEKQDDMKESDDSLDPLTGKPVYSLYGKTRVPLASHVKNIDGFLVDIFDPGCRIYTFVYTMANCMRVAAEHGKKVVVLDRPNPVGGEKVEGCILDPSLTSFVGQFPISTRHGMTVGELALMFNEEFKIGCELEVIPLPGWRRSMTAMDWNMPWIAPSPNLPTAETAHNFPGSVLFEGTLVSEGRGTTRPMDYVGAPYIEPHKLAREMNGLNLPGVFFRAHYFEPTYQKHAFKTCGGVQLHVIDEKAYLSHQTGLRLLFMIEKMYPQHFELKPPPYEYEHTRMPLDLIAGSTELRLALGDESKKAAFIEKSMEQAQAFQAQRQPYLLYKD